MSTLQTQIALIHVDSQLSATSACQRSSTESAFNSASIEVGNTDETISLGDVVEPKQVFLKLLSGDPVKVGFASGAYPMRLQDVNEGMILRLDVEGLRQTDDITVPADVAGNLGGKYFILDDRNSDAVWVWFNTGAGAGTAATGSITYGTPVVSDTVTVNGSTFTCVAGSPGANQFSNIAELEALVEAVTGVNSTEDGTTISITAASVGAAGNAITLSRTGTGTLAVSGATLTGGVDACVAPTPSSSRLIEVAIDVGDTAPDVAAAVASAIDDDAEFTASAVGAVVTVVDAHVGTRSTANAHGISGLSVSNVQAGAASPVVHLKSAGTTSQVVVGVAPN